MSGSNQTLIAVEGNRLNQNLLAKEVAKPINMSQTVGLRPEEVLELQIKTITGILEGHDGIVTSLEITQDSKYIISGASDFKILIWDTLLKKIDSALIGHDGEIACLSLCSSNKYLLSGSKDCTSKLWNFDKRTEIATFKGHSEQINDAAFAENFMNVITCSDDGTVKVWDYQGNLIQDLIENTEKVLCCISLNSYVISGSSDGRILVWDLKSFSLIKEILKVSESIVSLAESSDGIWFASAEQNEKVKIWNGTTLEIEFELKDMENIKQIKFSGNSEHLVVNSDEYFIYLWNLNLRKMDYTIELYPEKPNAVCTNLDCSIVVCGLNEKGFKIWSPYERRDELTLNIHDNEILSIACTSDERFLLSGSLDKTFKVFNLESKKVEWELKSTETHASEVFCLNRYHDMILSTHEDGSLKFWDLEANSLIKILKSHEGTIWHVEVSEELSLAASGSDDKKIVIWNLNSLEEEFILSDSTHIAYCLRFVKKTSKLISCGDDLCIKIWSIRGKKEEHSILAHSDSVLSIVLSIDEDYLFSCSTDNTITLWNMNTKLNEHTFEGHISGVCKIILMSSKEFLISASLDNLIKFWNIHKKKLEFSLDGHNDSVRAIVLNEAETNLFSGGDDFMIIIWNIDSMSIEFSLYGHHGLIRDLVFISEKSLISCSKDKFIVEWDLEIKKRKKDFVNEIGQILTVAISNDDNLAAFGNDNNAVIIADLISKTWQPIGGHNGIINCVTFSHDNKLLASASSDSKIKIWNLGKNKEEFSLIGHSSSVLAIAFNFNSKYLISGSSDDSLKIWNLETKKLENTLNYSSQVDCILCSKIQNIAYFGCGDGYVRSLSLNERKIQYSTPKANESSFKGIALDSSERLLFYSDYNVINVFDLTTQSFLFSFQGHARDNINGLVYLCNSSKLISCSSDKSIKIWNLGGIRRNKMIRFEKDKITLGMIIASDKNLLICALNNGEIKIWNMNDGSVYYRTQAHAGSVKSVQVSSSQEIFSSGADDKLIKVWSLNEKKLLFTLVGHTGTVYGLLFIKNDKMLVSCSSDESIRFWDLFTQREVQIFRDHHAVFYCLLLHNDMIISGTGDKKIVFWDYQSKLFELIGHNGKVRYIISHGNKILSGSDDKTIKYWDIQNRNLLFTFRSHSDAVSCLLLLDNSTLISCSHDKTIKSWDIESKANIETYEKHNDYIYSLVKLNKNQFISCSEDGNLRTWNLQNKKESGVFKVTSGKFSTLFTTTDYVFIGTEEGFIIIFDLNEEKEKEIIYAHKEEVLSLEYLSNESILISGSYDWSISFWDLKENKLIERKKAHIDPVNSLRITPDQKFLLSASEDTHIIIWKLTDRSIFKTLRGHKSGVSDVRISSDSSLVFSCSDDKTIRIWNLNAGKEIFCLVGHTNTVFNLALIEEQKTLISCSADKLIKFWDYESKREIFTLKGHDDQVKKLELSQNKKYLFSLSDDLTIKIWNICEKRLEYTLKDESFTPKYLKVIQDSNLFCCCYNQGLLKICEIQPTKSQKTREIRCENFTLICDNKFITNVEPCSGELNSQVENPLIEYVPTHALDVGFNDWQIFYFIVNSLKKDSFPKLISGIFSLKISACLFGVAHILSYLGKEEELSNMLSVDNAVIFSDVFGKSPFYYAIINNHNTCAEIVLNFLINSSRDMGSQEMITSMYSLRNDFELIIKSSIIQISKFLKSSILKSKFTFISSSIDIPSSKYNFYLMPISQDFDGITSYTERTQVYFTTFFIPLPIVSGSESSIELTESILNCQDKDILTSAIIKQFIDHQWDSLYPIIAIYSFTYFINIFLILGLLAYELD